MAEKDDHSMRHLGEDNRGSQQRSKVNQDSEWGLAGPLLLLLQGPFSNMQGLTLPSCVAFSCPSIYNLSYVTEQLILGRYETQVGLFLGSNYYNS